jgi:phosphatidylglycerophosphatase A
MFVLAFVPENWILWSAAFLLFRLFDIWKPFPIRQLDARLKNGFGVMFDDLLAAVYAIACLLPLTTWIISQH